ncbi:MAG TPA: hypothetical protein VFX98_15740 [Longimicrobiaceae bacterium]|nr:hypothetical protein [Longimicrobiaceae bacterium]
MTRPRAVFARSLAATVVLCLAASVVGRTLNRPRVVAARVTEKRWEREISVLERRTVVEDSSELPEGARLLEVRAVPTGSERVLDSYAGPGSVAVERSEPVYQPRYRYQLERWVQLDTPLRRAGTVEPPAWPDAKLGPTRRAYRRDEDYWITLTTARGRTYYERVSLAEFVRWRVGQAARLRLRGDNLAAILGNPEP